MMRWEYRIMKANVARFLGPKVEVDKLQHALGSLGEQGWELVSVEDTTVHSGVSNELLFFLKRPRSESL